MGGPRDLPDLRPAHRELAATHGVVSREEVDEVMKKMGRRRRRTERGRPRLPTHGARFRPASAFRAACELVLEGRVQPSGYTEPILHARRLEAKAALAEAA